MELFDGSGQRHYVSFTLPVSAWSHVAATADGEQLMLYVNGLELGHVTAGIPVPNRLPLMIGQGCPEMLLDDIRFYARALTPAEVGSLARP